MRRLFTHIILLFLAINTSFLYTNAQSISVADRTPEQEATKQTEKMQKELNLTSEQVKSIYEINLKYARERKQSNKRSDAVERIKKKNEEIGKVLNSRQNSELQSKRSEVQSVEIDGKRRYTNSATKVRVADNPRQSSATNQRSGDPRQDTRNRPVRTTDSQRDAQLRTTEITRSSTASNDRPVRQDNNRTTIYRTSEPRRSERQSSPSGYDAATQPDRNSSSGSYERNAPVRNSVRSAGADSSSGNRSSSESSGRESNRSRK